MVREIIYRNSFEKDVKKAKKRGKNLKKLQLIAQMIVEGKTLPQKYRDHSLFGNYAYRRECHIESDWLLIYKLEHQAVIFERTGTHSDLFE